MSEDTRRTMAMALIGMEQAVNTLASTYEHYRTAYREASRRLERQADVANVLGTDRVDAALAGRLCALGLEQVLAHSASNSVGANWTDKLTARIEQLLS